jgi:hypothetical protein
VREKRGKKVGVSIVKKIRHLLPVSGRKFVANDGFSREAQGDADFPQRPAFAPSRPDHAHRLHVRALSLLVLDDPMLSGDGVDHATHRRAWLDFLA